MIAWNCSPIAEEHIIGDFDCSVESLDKWLQNNARRLDASGVARTFVWTAPDDSRVFAYFAICPTEVRRQAVGNAMAGGSTIVPAYLLARLALDRSLQGQGLGRQLLLAALERIVFAADMGGGRLIVVDAIDDSAVSFYRKYGFKSIKENPQRLVMKVATARKAISG